MMRSWFYKVVFMLGVFIASMYIVYWATNHSGELFQSTPYYTRNMTSDAELSRLTRGSGAPILDGVIMAVKVKAEEKG